MDKNDWWCLLKQPRTFWFFKIWYIFFRGKWRKFRSFPRNANVLQTSPIFFVVLKQPNVAWSSCISEISPIYLSAAKNIEKYRRYLWNIPAVWPTWDFNGRKYRRFRRNILWRSKEKISGENPKYSDINHFGVFFAINLIFFQNISDFLRFFSTKKKKSAWLFQKTSFEKSYAISKNAYMPLCLRISAI